MKCVKCRRNEAAAGRKLCAACLEKVRVQYWQRKASGMCVDCGKRPARLGRTTCEACGSARTEYEINRQSVLHMHGLCIRCRQPVHDDAWLCPACRTKKRAEVSRNGRKSADD